MCRKTALLLCAVVALAGCAAPAPKPSPQADPLAWARGKVWYQVFPERFRNGDPANDPVAADVLETDGKHRWHLSPWTSDWYEEQPWELKRSTDFYHMGVVFARRYGGDIQGITDKLDYLKDLGVEVIYLNPVFEAPSLHKYDASSLHHVDLHFGPDPATDLTRDQVLEQCAMLIAMARFVRRFGLSAGGVPYQQGLAQSCAASDFAEGAIGSTDRFPIPDHDGTLIRPGKPIPCVNEVDMGTAMAPRTCRMASTRMTSGTRGRVPSRLLSSTSLPTST